MSENQDDLFSNSEEEKFGETYYEKRNFEKVRMPGERFREIEFQDCKFKNCDFQGSIFDLCQFVHCTFESCNLSLTRILNSSFNRVDFLDSKTVGMNWTEVNPLSFTINFKECILNNSNFFGLSLVKMNWIKCTAKEVDFSNANLTSADFSETDLTGARFMHTNLTRANLKSARNYSINTNENILRKTIFSYPEVMALLNQLDIVIE
jgi:uncharacterized protein YjbI with pentapeptide repeats